MKQKYTSSKVAERNRKNSKNSPWRKHPMVETFNAVKTFRKNQSKQEGSDE